MKEILLENASADISGTAESRGSQKFLISVVGELDGCTVTPEATLTPDDEDSWTALNDEIDNPIAIIKQTQDFRIDFLPHNYSFRCTISDAGASTDITVTIVG